MKNMEFLSKFIYFTSKIRDLCQNLVIFDHKNRLSELVLKFFRSVLVPKLVPKTQDRNSSTKTFSSIGTGTEDFRYWYQFRTDREFGTEKPSITFA